MCFHKPGKGVSPEEPNVIGTGKMRNRENMRMCGTDLFDGTRLTTILCSKTNPMESQTSMPTGASVKVECRKRTSRVIAEGVAVIVVCFMFAGLAWGLLASHPVLRIICLLVFVTGAAILIVTLAKNPPWLVLANKTLEARCYPLGTNGELGKPKQMVTPLERLERVWVGRARDYPAGLLMNHADSRTFPWARTMVFWLKSENDVYLIREFSWLSETERLLDQLRESGIRVECS